MFFLFSFLTDISIFCIYHSLANKVVCVGYLFIDPSRDVTSASRFAGNK